MGIEQAEIDFVPRYNIAPTQTAIMIASDGDGHPGLRRARWGLIPFWAKDEKIGTSLVNARAEGIETKPAFRNSFKKRRCAVMADGFFEWQKVPGGKQPMYIHLKEGRPFVFGGLWDRWNDLETFTIITVKPNELVAGIHDRMPLILPEEAIARWLDPNTSAEEVSAMLRPFAAGEMACFPVSTIVNTPKVDSSDCVKRVEPGAPLKLERVIRRKVSERGDEPMLPGLG
jgi:putative SOS response-associated peptidase YedK